ncbi:MAG TPA: isoprenylcysteine carboxylmethyltransferase family protein [Steroidobacteraceae bacterium]|nr:isoprenylcysteine carboxylmethyltransferase family protein [Steroidobacteraceae bacterium]
MRSWPSLLIDALWIIWLVYWVVSAQSTKRSRERESVRSRAGFLSAMGLVVLLLAVHRWPGVLGMRVVGGDWIRYACALALVLVGLAFSMWARSVLGENWSGTVTIKVDHELIRRGPYRRIRHPIYTGILLALLGSALATGQLRGLLAVVIACIAFRLKSHVEEAWMERQFGEQYAAYRRSSWAFLPFVL